MKLKYIFWYFLVGFWILWLCLISIKSSNNIVRFVANKITPVYTKLNLENTKYILFESGSEVIKDQLLGYNIDSIEITQLQSLLNSLGTYNDFNSLKSSLLKLEIKDNSINKSIEKIIMAISMPNKVNFNKTKPQYQTVQKVVDRESLIKIAENDLANAQTNYSKREIDLNTLKKYVDKLKTAKESPESIKISKKQIPQTAKLVEHTVKLNSQLQNLIYTLITEVQDKIAKAEIKSSTNGVLHLDGISKYSVWVQDNEKEIEFGLYVNQRFDSVINIEIVCDNSKIIKTQSFKQKATGSFNYKFKMATDDMNACKSNNSKHVNVLIYTQAKSVMSELIGKIRKLTCE